MSQCPQNLGIYVAQLTKLFVLRTIRRATGTGKTAPLITHKSEPNLNLLCCVPRHQLLERALLQRPRPHRSRVAEVQPHPRRSRAKVGVAPQSAEEGVRRRRHHRRVEYESHRAELAGFGEGPSA